MILISHCIKKSNIKNLSLCWPTWWWSPSFWLLTFIPSSFQIFIESLCAVDSSSSALSLSSSNLVLRSFVNLLLQPFTFQLQNIYLFLLHRVISLCWHSMFDKKLLLYILTFLSFAIIVSLCFLFSQHMIFFTVSRMYLCVGTWIIFVLYYSNSCLSPFSLSYMILLLMAWLFSDWLTYLMKLLSLLLLYKHVLLFLRECSFGLFQSHIWLPLIFSKAFFSYLLDHKDMLALIT